MKGAEVITGTVVHGKALGRTVGMPTANVLLDDPDIVFESGVYATIAEFEGKRMLSVTNIGLRPTVDNSPVPTIEAYIIGFSGNLYEKRIALTVIGKIRPVMRFDSLEMVKKQVEKDCVAAQNMLNRYKTSGRT